MSTTSHQSEPSVATSFPSFQRLPSELRVRIWKMALTENWSVSAFKFTTPHDHRYFRMERVNAGSIVGQACIESRVEMMKLYTRIEVGWSRSWGSPRSYVGWVYMPRHLFVFPPSTHDRPPFVTVSEACLEGILQEAEHVVIMEPSGLSPHQDREHRSIDYEIQTLQTFCRCLRTLTIVAPWKGGTAGERYDVFQSTVNELAWRPLVHDLEDPTPLTPLEHFRVAIPHRPQPALAGGASTEPHDSTNRFTVNFKEEWAQGWDHNLSGEPPVFFLRTPSQVNPQIWRQAFEGVFALPARVHAIVSD